MRRIIYPLLFSIAGFAGIASGAATVSILTPPANLTPGQPVTLSVQYLKTSDEPEKRVVIRVDLHDADTNQKVAGGISDNSGAGHTPNSATVPCTLTVPSNASGSYYFKATVAPWSLNKAIVAHYKSYPTDGKFTYLWGGDLDGYGVTRNVYYLGQLIAPKPPGDTTYCSGLAFEACVIPYTSYNTAYGHSRIGNMTVSDMRAFRVRWYGAESPAEKLAAAAIPDWNIGVEITDFEEAQEGDFVQLWRRSGSGHNPLFVSWKRNNSNQITGVNYWGSQGSTNGIGYNDENFGFSSGINRDRFYIARLRKPRDQADYDWALGQASTQSKPSTVGSAVQSWYLY